MEPSSTNPERDSYENANRISHGSNILWAPGLEGRYGLYWMVHCDVLCNCQRCRSAMYIHHYAHQRAVSGRGRPGHDYSEDGVVLFLERQHYRRVDHDRA